MTLLLFHSPAVFFLETIVFGIFHRSFNCLDSMPGRGEPALGALFLALA